MSEKYKDLPNTSFPDSLDNFPSMQDLNASDMPFVKQYQSYMINGDLNNASKVLEQIPNGQNKLISAKKYNQLRDAVLAEERFFKNDVTTHLENVKNEVELQFSQFNYKGFYNNTTQYERMNIVSYVGANNLEELYLCMTKPPVGTVPSDSNYWRKFTVQGLKGEKGDGLSYNGIWNSTTNYSQGSLVAYGNTLWHATKPSLNQVPFSGSSYWTNALDISSQSIPVVETAPTWLVEGDIWFKIVG